MEGTYRKAVFIAVYFKEKKGMKYLILKRKLHWNGWEFPKGGLEEGERIEDAIKREVKEETGLNIKGKIKRFNVSGSYRYERAYSDRPGFVGQSYSLYAVEVNGKKVKLDEREHADYEWLEIGNAVSRLTWPNQKRCLRIVDFWLRGNKFRKFITENSVLILAGKDDGGNEELIKQVSPEEYVFHTTAAGSPFVNIKGKSNNEDVKIAAIFCAKYSRDWKKNKRDIEVHKFRGKDIYKNKLMKKGTFGIKKFDKILVKKKDIEKFRLF